jgi:hypothetical protein
LNLLPRGCKFWLPYKKFTRFFSVTRVKNRIKHAFARKITKEPRKNGILNQKHKKGGPLEPEISGHPINKAEILAKKNT